MNKLTFFAAAVLASSISFAETIKLDCGRAMNVPRTVVISEKETNGYTHSAIYKTSGNDEVTGTLRQVTYKMAGQFDLSTEFTGKEVPVLALLSLENPSIQLVIKKAFKEKGVAIPAIHINLATESVDQFNCYLK